MKRLFSTLVAVLAFYGGANAQLLYRISGNGLEKPSYIVGTYHIAPASFVDDIEGARQAMVAVEQVYGEVDMNDAAATQITMLKAMMLPEGKTITNLFTAEEMERINAYMRNVLGVDFNNAMVASQMGRFRPSVLAMQFMVMQYIKMTPDFDATNLIDDYFQKEARKAGKRVGGFETAEFQIDLLYGSKTIEEEREELLELVDNNDAILEEMKVMTDAYFSFDIKAIDKLTMAEVESGDMTTEEFASMLTDRNHRWVEAMPQIMQEASTLFVVGAGHLPGSEGVLELLKEAGYKVKAVK